MTSTTIIAKSFVRNFGGREAYDLHSSFSYSAVHGMRRLNSSFARPIAKMALQFQWSHRRVGDIRYVEVS